MAKIDKDKKVKELKAPARRTTLAFGHIWAIYMAVLFSNNFCICLGYSLATCFQGQQITEDDRVCVVQNVETAKLFGTRNQDLFARPTQRRSMSSQKTRPEHYQCKNCFANLVDSCCWPCCSMLT